MVELACYFMHYEVLHLITPLSHPLATVSTPAVYFHCITTFSPLLQALTLSYVRAHRDTALPCTQAHCNTFVGS